MCTFSPRPRKYNVVGILLFCCLFLLPFRAVAASVYFVITCRDGNITTGDNRKTGLTPTFIFFKKLSDGTDVSQPSITAVGQGQYKFAYDAVTNGEVSYQIDFGASLANPSDRYVDGVCSADSPLIATNLNATVSGIPAAIQAMTVLNVPGTGTTNGSSMTLNQVQFNALVSSLTGRNKSMTGGPTVSGTSTVNYYLTGKPKTSPYLVATETVSYDAIRQPSGSVILIANPFPTVP